MASILYRASIRARAHIGQQMASQPGVLFEIGGEMHEKLGVVLAGDGLVGNSRLNVT
jgi:hypothetical protein